MAFGFGLWPLIEAMFKDFHPEPLNSCIQYIMVLSLIRLLFAILRLSSAIFILLYSCCKWTCRKRVKKGKIFNQDLNPNENELPSNYVYDGVPLKS